MILCPGHMSDIKLYFCLLQRARQAHSACPRARLLHKLSPASRLGRAQTPRGSNLTALHLCFDPCAHHLFEGRLYDPHHQALQADNLLHVKADRGVADSFWVLRLLRRTLLGLRLVRAAVLGQAYGRCACRVLQQVADFSQPVRDKSVKELGGHDGSSRTCMSVKYAPEVERDPCAILHNDTDTK